MASSNDHSVWADPSRRNLFRYFDGTRERVGDPLEICRKMLYESGVEFDADLALSTSKLADAEMRILAMGRLSGAIRDAFGIAPIGLDDNGQVTGMTDTELFDHVLAPFIEYVDGLKKNGEPS